jgi:hypothetical protein
LVGFDRFGKFIFDFSKILIENGQALHSSFYKSKAIFLDWKKIYFYKKKQLLFYFSLNVVGLNVMLYICKKIWMYLI